MTAERRPNEAPLQSSAKKTESRLPPPSDTADGETGSAAERLDRERLGSEPTSKAMRLAESGAHVFPLDHPSWPDCRGAHGNALCDGKRGKHPLGPWSRHASTRPEDIRRMFGRGPFNIGIACGPSGLLVVDQDGPNGLAAYAATIGADVPPTRAVRTGRGTHLWFEHDHETNPVGNAEGLLADLDLNIRGAGGYVVGRGSVHENGTLYEFLNPDAPVLPTPVWLLHAITTRRNRPNSPRAGRTVPRSAPIAEGHRHTTLVSYAGRLRSSGLTLDEVRPLFLERFKDCVQPPGAGAAPRYLGNAREEPFTEQEALTILDDVFDRYEGTQLPEDLIAEWTASAPTPLTASRSRPEFPVVALPHPVAAMVSAVAEFTQTDPAMAGSTSLAMLATAAGGRVQVEITPGWREPVNLYTATVAAPGERKSAVLATMSAPLQSAESQLVERAQQERLEALTTKDVAQKAAETARRDAGKTRPEQRDKALSEAISAMEAAEAIEVPASPRMLADDITPERCAGLLAEQGGRLAVVSAEGGIFETIAGRYSGGVPSLDVWLKGHSGDSIRVDRQSRGPQIIQSPALTLCLMIQPSVLSTIARHPDFRGRGLLARFLYSVPTSMVGRRAIEPAPIASTVQAEYEQLVEGLALGLADWHDPAIVRLSPEARQLLTDFAREIEPQLGLGGGLHHIADWGGKLVGATVRIAGLVHLAQHPGDGWRRQLEAPTMGQAITLRRYYQAQALLAFDEMRADPAVADADYLLSVVRRLASASVSRRDLHAASSRSRFPRVNHLDEPLRILEDHGHLRRVQDAPRSGPGRPPSPIWLVHPSLIADDLTADR